MQRPLAALADETFDLIIVGGGIFGACAAWDATLRGMKVALLERLDFGAGASANSFKMIHGGIRYLQHLDLPRLRASCRERSAFLRVAPHLAHPLPIAIPTYGHGRKGKAFLGTGMLLYDLLTLDRNRGIADPARRIPLTRFLSREEILAEFPDLPSEGLTGAAVFADGQMYNPTRLTWSFVRSASEHGATVCNHIEVTRLLDGEDAREAAGVMARDLVSGEEIPIRGRCILNTAGPWAARVLAGTPGVTPPRTTFSRDTCFLVRRRFGSDLALAVSARTRDPDAILSRDARHLFLVPWRDWTLVGVWHVVYPRDADHLEITPEQLESYLDEINWAYPTLNLTPDDITICNAGLVPFGENDPDARDLSYGKRSVLIDHERQGECRNLVTLIGIRYTMARGDSARAVDLAARKLGFRTARPPTDRLPVHGGDFDHFDALVAEIRGRLPSGDAAVAESLAHNHGSAYGEVLDSARGPEDLEPIESTRVLPAQIRHAVRNEMALSLADVVFRRTDLATGGHPGDSVLDHAARLVGEVLGWNETTLTEQRAAVARRFDCLGNWLAAESLPKGAST
ncbi:MAG TPA: glycerol-3-phosphate dehydrogenase/oxidase [Thiotrichales bacterium]|nr:glycerol-3-phosphate dehydrogenase/oxidase [Thiotrichales bacterium]